MLCHQCQEPKGAAGAGLAPAACRRSQQSCVAAQGVELQYPTPYNRACQPPARASSLLATGYFQWKHLVRTRCELTWY